MLTTLVSIQHLFAADIPHLTVLTPDGWDDVAQAFLRYLDMPFCEPVKAVSNNNIVGLGCLIYYEDTVWLAAIIVHPQYRNQGIGRTITQALIDRVDRRQYKTIMLDATDFGYPVYKRLGFELVTEYAHYKGGLIDSSNTENIVPFQPEHIERILQLDKQSTAENRQDLLMMHLKDAVVYVHGNKPEGMFLPSLYRGPVIAATTEAGLSLMQYRMTMREHCMLPAANTAGAQLLERNGFIFRRTSRRMYLGAPLEWRPGNIYNTINGAMG